MFRTWIWGMRNWLWCSTRSQMSCTRNNSPVLYFLMSVMTDYIFSFSFEYPVASMNSLEGSQVWLMLVLVPLTVCSMTVFIYKPAHPGFALCGNTNVSSWFEMDSWTFFSPCCFPPVKSLEASLSCARLVAVGPQEDCVISCCRLTSSVYNTCSPTTPFWWLSPVC